MGEFGPWHLLIVAVVFVLLFGAKKLPEAARSIGRSMRIFKSEVRGLHDDDAPHATPAAPAPVTPPEVATSTGVPIALDTPATPVPATGKQPG
ncbi:Sec-independent protein translocase subunit TatA [Pseudofrankia sp. DC12]|uniref:Sec-independent protein translocase subunit TatA n=1 Tax=Pseudofrankia sp. DC12 TaxID=683315 RepID=UPI000A058436|nr:Sec-independent protein translocase subunit TatA [Pseudofrankia sp. DC12]